MSVLMKQSVMKFHLKMWVEMSFAHADQVKSLKTAMDVLILPNTPKKFTDDAVSKFFYKFLLKKEIINRKFDTIDKINL